MVVGGGSAGDDANDYCGSDEDDGTIVVDDDYGFGDAATYSFVAGKANTVVCFTTVVKRCRC